MFRSQLDSSGRGQWYYGPVPLWSRDCGGRSSRQCHRERVARRVGTGRDDGLRQLVSDNSLIVTTTTAPEKLSFSVCQKKKKRINPQGTILSWAGTQYTCRVSNRYSLYPSPSSLSVIRDFEPSVPTVLTQKPLPGTLYLVSSIATFYLFALECSNSRHNSRSIRTEPKSSSAS